MTMRFENFKEILVNGYVKNEIRLRNNKKIRKILAEMGTILCLSRKKHSLNPIKVGKDEYQITNMKNNLKATKILYANGIFRKEDPKELFIPINEFAYHISLDSNNTVNACYWVEWLIQYELYSKQKNTQKKVSMIYIPPFILGFIALSIISSTGLFPDDIIASLSSLSKYLLILAMSAIGLSVSIKYILIFQGIQI